MRSSLKVFFDGGCRPNPGEMETAVFVGGLAHIRQNLGFGSSGEAEWLALIEAARLAIELGARDVEFVGDSATVVGQAKGVVKCRGAVLGRHFDAFHDLAQGIARVRIRRVGRSQNLAGIALAKLHSGL